ncbi:Flap endonuclease 1 [Caligus rogercresseyi]|uniref:Flap endonuclease 1 n=1 Tax=Caligus rogercresseyi TaxID=217165 RepID=A0A7T8JY57_CALRO|nr:Flap endonuclease 1 [Caligus rogercresseyi]
MSGEKGFAEDRIRNGAKKLLKARQDPPRDGWTDSFKSYLALGQRESPVTLGLDPKWICQKE